MAQNIGDKVYAPVDVGESLIKFAKEIERQEREKLQKEKDREKESKTLRH